MRIEIFHSPTCPHCPEAIKVVREVAEECGIKVEEINVLSPNGLIKAEGRGVKSTPTIFVGEVKIVGVPSRERLKKAIERLKSE
jgi:small redox-active disulfide protein 1